MKLTNGQKNALRELEGDSNLFLTGRAGTGKSFLIAHYLEKHLDRMDLPVLASTGRAAVILGGRTFHSFFGLGIMAGSMEDVIERAVKDKRVKRRLKKCSTIIVDEISMISGPALRAAAEIAQNIRDQKKPWGGIRMIVVGDFAQLPPISRDGKKAWAFLEPLWGKSKFEPLILDEVLRSTDDEFNMVLNDVREGNVTERVEFFLNDRKGSADIEDDTTRLFPRRDTTDQFNLERLAQLKGKVHTFSTTYMGQEHGVEQLKREAPIPEVLQVKKDAWVMMVINDPKQRFVNGSVGKVRHIDDSTIDVEVHGRRIDVEPVSFSVLNGDGDPVATATNFPLQLAWASTIHKAQGMTLDRVQVDLESLWEPGHAYVALSRARSGKGVYVSKWNSKSIRTDPLVSEFYRRGCPPNFGDDLEYTQQ